MTKKPSIITIKQNSESPIPVEVLADSIVAISKGMKAVLDGPLQERAILLLIADACERPIRNGNTIIGIKTVKAVLDGIKDLERQFVKSKSGKT